MHLLLDWHMHDLVFLGTNAELIFFQARVSASSKGGVSKCLIDCDAESFFMFLFLLALH